jgi:hypothetical protein
MSPLSSTSASSAQEIHLEGISSISGDSTAATLSAEGEPTTTCDTGDVSENVSAGGTTGTVTLELTGCHATVFGLGLAVDRGLRAPAEQLDRAQSA